MQFNVDAQKSCKNNYQNIKKNQILHLFFVKSFLMIKTAQINFKVKHF